MKTDREYIELLEQYSKRHYSQEELQELLQWLDSESGEEAYNIYLGSRLEEACKAGSDYPDKLAQKILRRVKKQVGIKTTPSWKTVMWRSVAAVLLLLASSGAAYWILGDKSYQMEDEQVVLCVEKGNKAMVTLLDGSKVWLNSDSRLKYSKKDARDVTLEGEAYFEVAKDKKHRFKVHTPYASIQVYGTSFNVSAHSNDSLFSVSLIEGSIGLTMNNQSKEVRMRPNEVAYYDQKKSRFLVARKNMDGVGLWRSNELKLTDVDIPTLWSRMGCWYSMDFIIQNEPVKKHLYNVTIQTESVEEMLGLINQITPIEYVIKGKEVIINYK
ncbi:FecR family protein [Bacteroides sp.]|uniref:FecR family protein n=1 Tax=Bacteroides sp. TaxID=29523 RepID=UPI003AB78FA6